MNYLVSTPPGVSQCLARLEKRPRPDWFLDADPPAQRLGSGGGSVHLLRSAWQAMSNGLGFLDWLRISPSIMIHGGGQARRLPAYAPFGKLFIPMPVWRWAIGQTIDQTLLDLHRTILDRLYANAPASYRLMIASGDVLVRFEAPPAPFPEADVLCIGLWGKPDDAQHFGVFFCERTAPHPLAFFKQKPSPATIQEHARSHLFMLDAGIWLLGERAIAQLLSLGGIDDMDAGSDPPQPVKAFELYSEFGRALGSKPDAVHPGINALTVAVVALDDGEFHHLGCSRDLIESSLRLQNRSINRQQQRVSGVKAHPDLFVQNARIDYTWHPENHRIWIESCHIGKDWKLTADHILTGIPENRWNLRLAPGQCLDVVPLKRMSTDAAMSESPPGDRQFAFRFYGMHDTFKGEIGDPATTWCEHPAGDWFVRRNLSFEAVGISPRTDIQDAPIFPVLSTAEADAGFLQWLLETDSDSLANARSDYAARYCRCARVSASALSLQADPDRRYRLRRRFLAANLPALANNHAASIFYATDLAHMAGLFVEERLDLPPVPGEDTSLMTRVHDRMFRAEVTRLRHDNAWHSFEDEAFALLRHAILEPLRERKVRPCCAVAPDQLVWARCPVRLDLAGGWTDTPPYCQLNGGCVVNVAVNLNGQPPLQCYVRHCEDHHILLRSIDLGSEVRITAYDGIGCYADVTSEFSIARAALALAGFHPAFSADAWSSLGDQLHAFGGGLEISFVAAVPKGSGLGTSSILASTILGALGDCCNLGWDRQEICLRTMALEQMLTSGGGWQDQFGAVWHGVKRLETPPGITQSPQVRWLPEQLLDEAFRNGHILLYYTGITRVAKGILQEIVRGMFLNDGHRLAILDAIGRHARDLVDVIQAADWQGLAKGIARTWDLNRQLDAGTNPPPVQQLLDRIGDYTAGAKLLGAGGGGYLLIIAKDADAAHRIRREFCVKPPNRGARFVNPEISWTGLQVTRS